MSTEPYLLDRLHADRERQFRHVAEHRRSVRALAPTNLAQRVLRWRPAGSLGWARRFASAITVTPNHANGLHR